MSTSKKSVGLKSFFRRRETKPALLLLKEKPFPSRPVYPANNAAKESSFARSKSELSRILPVLGQHPITLSDGSDSRSSVGSSVHPETAEQATSWPGYSCLTQRIGSRMRETRSSNLVRRYRSRLVWRPCKSSLLVDVPLLSDDSAG